MGPTNGIIGDAEYGTELPVMELPEQDLTEEKNAAKFSRTKEFAKLKGKVTARIAYYQQCLPDGRSMLEKDYNFEQLGMNWAVANAVIAELVNLISEYETANEVVKADAQRRA
jgi:hypothetical protein